MVLERGDRDGGRALLADPPAPPDPLVALRVAAAEAQAGQFADAAAHLDDALQRADLPPALAATAGSILELGGRSDAALRVYEKALRSEPGAWQLQNGVAWILASERRDLDRALELARAAVEGSGGDPVVLDTLATVELHRGDAGAALRTADRALPRADEALRPHLLFVRAQALHALGRSGPARSALARALASSGDPPPPWQSEAIAFEKRIGSDTSAAAPPP
ncbi:MAG: hypothetical protein DCC71_16895 [Proteobacteria bacterium]|nr:MAG: hypothetical protein DCC71_16895 [Pseudomonadota bacterium]